MTTVKRPYTTTEYVGGGVSLYVCQFCGDNCVDQTLESWESCCQAFELACERDELKAEIARRLPMSSSDDIVDRLRSAWPKYPWADEAADEIERLRDDMHQITGLLAGVGTVHTEDGALAGINNLPSVQAAWKRWLCSDD